MISDSSLKSVPKCFFPYLPTTSLQNYIASGSKGPSLRLGAQAKQPWQKKSLHWSQNSTASRSSHWTFVKCRSVTPRSQGLQNKMGGAKIRRRRKFSFWPLSSPQCSWLAHIDLRVRSYATRITESPDF